jgi:hypothetical protein
MLGCVCGDNHIDWTDNILVEEEVWVVIKPLIFCLIFNVVLGLLVFGLIKFVSTIKNKPKK